MKSFRLLVASLITVIFPLAVSAAGDYQLGPDSQEQPGVPQGKISQYKWTSNIFDGTVRDYWVYVPAEYDPQKPACVMVFQDGGAYVNKKGDFRVPVVFDNLIYKKDMPVTIGNMIASIIGAIRPPGRVKTWEMSQARRARTMYSLTVMVERIDRVVSIIGRPSILVQVGWWRNR